MVLALCMSSFGAWYLYEALWIYFEQFQSYRADTILSRNYYLESSKEAAQKVSIQELWFCALHVA